MKRRNFIVLLGGAAAWPIAARAQQPDRVRRIGVLMNVTANDPVGKVRLTMFLQGLEHLGWIEGRNVRIDSRWAAGDAELSRRYAAELLALAPDVILTAGASNLGPLLLATRSVPIVFVQRNHGGGATDPQRGAGKCIPISDRTHCRCRWCSCRVHIRSQCP